jgi:hypothetical protein
MILFAEIRKPSGALLGNRLGNWTVTFAPNLIVSMPAFSSACLNASGVETIASAPRRVEMPSINAAARQIKRDRDEKLPRPPADRKIEQRYFIRYSVNR